MFTLLRKVAATHGSVKLDAAAHGMANRIGSAKMTNKETCSAFITPDVRRHFVWTHPTRSKIDFLLPDPNDIHIEDIAHHLSLVCRFGGAVPEHYSVAQHSVLVSYQCHPHDALAGLMHDAAEYVVGDMVSPLKHTDGLAGYREAEARVWRAICWKFGLSEELPKSVHIADSIIGAAENHWRKAGLGAYEGVTHPVVVYGAWSSYAAKNAFLSRFNELCAKR